MKTFKIALGQGERLLDGVVRSGIALAHDCGGALACATCRVAVLEGLESLSEADADERDMLDKAGSAGSQARLACQAIGSGADVVIALPAGPPARRGVAGASARPIDSSEDAAKHLAAQLARIPGAVAVRLTVQQSGCSGLRYRLEHVKSFREDDAVFETGGVRIAVDAASLPYVEGTTLYLVEEGLSRRLRFDNPNARQSCGCGESFAA